MKKVKKAFAMNDDYMQENGLREASPGATGAEEKILAEILPWEGLSAQVDQVVQGLSGVRSGGQVYLVDARQLEPYPEQPFHQYPPEALQELAEDIGRVGILSPILVRRMTNKLQILAGHNRWQAAKLAGLSHVPVLILDVDDDDAILVLTGTNLRQRERLLPSEKAFAYKMQLEALKRQGQKSESGYDAAALITRQTGDSRMQIHRYIRLTELHPELLKLVDSGKISMTPAVAISALKPGEQGDVLEYFRGWGGALTIEKATALKIASENNTRDDLQREEIHFILNGSRLRTPMWRSKYIKLPTQKIRELLPDGMPEELVEDYICEALKKAGRRRRRKQPGPT